MAIYTRKGDDGETSLFTGTVVSKDSPLIEALGDIDECNATIGAAVALLPDDTALDDCRKQLKEVQRALFALGAAVGTPKVSADEDTYRKTRFNAENTTILEHWIDAMAKQVSPLQTFILPGGHPAGAMLHVARGVCRRAERTIVVLFHQEEVDREVMVYLNRLSDYLFETSRYVNDATGCPEKKWTPKRR